MGENGYYLPESYDWGENYFIRTKDKDGLTEFNEVIFLCYRPHPGEVMVRYKNKDRMVYRSDLFTRKYFDIKPISELSSNT